MALTDKEIALELAKSYVEHLNVRANLKGMHSNIDSKYLAGAYAFFYKTVSSVGKNETESN